MYIRWKRRKRTDQWSGAVELVLSPIRVMSVRVDGQPRQKHIAYLGSITVSDIRR